MFQRKPRVGKFTAGSFHQGQTLSHMNARQFMTHGIVIRGLSLPPLFISINRVTELPSLSLWCTAIWRGPVRHLPDPEQVWKLSPVKKQGWNSSNGDLQPNDHDWFKGTALERQLDSIMSLGLVTVALEVILLPSRELLETLPVLQLVPKTASSKFHPLSELPLSLCLHWLLPTNSPSDTSALQVWGEYLHNWFSSQYWRVKQWHAVSAFALQDIVPCEQSKLSDIPRKTNGKGVQGWSKVQKEDKLGKKKKINSLRKRGVRLQRWWSEKDNFFKTCLSAISATIHTPDKEYALHLSCCLVWLPNTSTGKHI